LCEIFGKNAFLENDVTSCKLWSSPKAHFRQKDAQDARNGVIQVFLKVDFVHLGRWLPQLYPFFSAFTPHSFR